MKRNLVSFVGAPGFLYLAACFISWDFPANPADWEMPVRFIFLLAAVYAVGMTYSCPIWWSK